MAYITIDDFYEKADSCTVLTREQEKNCFELMKNGDTDARRQLIESYMPMVAAHIKHLRLNRNKLSLALYCLQALEKAVDSFDFSQDSETFSHRLSWYLRQTVTEYIVK